MLSVRASSAALVGAAWAWNGVSSSAAKAKDVVFMIFLFVSNHEISELTKKRNMFLRLQLSLGHLLYMPDHLYLFNRMQIHFAAPVPSESTSSS